MIERALELQPRPDADAGAPARLACAERSTTRRSATGCPRSATRRCDIATELGDPEARAYACCGPAPRAVGRAAPRRADRGLDRDAHAGAPDRQPRAPAPGACMARRRPARARRSRRRRRPDRGVRSRRRPDSARPLFEWNSLVWRAMRALLDGSLDRADRLASEALAAGAPAEAVTAAQYYAIQVLGDPARPGADGRARAGRATAGRGQPGSAGVARGAGDAAVRGGQAGRGARGVRAARRRRLRGHPQGPRLDDRDHAAERRVRGPRRQRPRRAPVREARAVRGRQRRDRAGRGVPRARPRASSASWRRRRGGPISRRRISSARWQPTPRSKRPDAWRARRSITPGRSDRAPRADELLGGGGADRQRARAGRGGAQDRRAPRAVSRARTGAPRAAATTRAGPA